MTHSQEKHMRFVLALCSISLVALTCAGCLASSKYQDMTWNYNSAEKEFSEKTKKQDAIWKGEYLGIKKDSPKHNNRSVYHYQFQGLLEGEERTLHFILPLDSCYGTYAAEGERIESPSAQPAWLVLAENHSKEELEKIAQDIQKQCPLAAHANILYLNLRLGGHDEFHISMTPEMANNWQNHRIGNEWDGYFLVSWKSRSRIMHALRYAYANAVALMYVPADVALAVTSPVWVPLLVLAMANQKW